MREKDVERSVVEGCEVLRKEAVLVGVQKYET